MLKRVIADRLAYAVQCIFPIFAGNGTVIDFLGIFASTKNNSCFFEGTYVYTLMVPMPSCSAKARMLNLA